MLNKLITSGLVFLLLQGVAHVDIHHDDHEPGYGICDISCNEGQHHSIAHHCEKCLNKNSESIKYEQKVLGATFRQGKHVGYWYKREGRLEIFRSDKLVKTLYLVEESRAEFHFKRWVRSNQ